MARISASRAWQAPKPVVEQQPPPREPVDPLLVVTIVYMLVSVMSINELLPFLMPLRLALVCVVIAVLLYLGQAKGLRSPQRMYRQRPARLVLFLFGFIVATLPIVTAPGAVLDFAFKTFSTVVVLFLLMVAVARGTRDFQRFAMWYVLGNVFFATHAVQNFDVIQSASWRMGDVSGMYDANDFAVLCVGTLPLAIHFARSRGPIFGRLGAAWGLFALTEGIVLSGSRGGFIATAATGVFLLFRSPSIPVRWRIIGVLAVSAVFALKAGDTYWEQMSSIMHPGEDYNVTSEFGRKGLWKRGVGYALQYPIAGVGANNFSFAEGTISTAEILRQREQGIGTPWSAPHNSYVQVLSEMGFVGMGIFLTMLAATWQSMSKAARSETSPQLRSLVDALRASVVGTLVGIFFLSHAYSAMLYSVLAMAVIAGKVLGGRPVSPGSNRSERPGLLGERRAAAAPSPR